MKFCTTPLIWKMNSYRICGNFHKWSYFSKRATQNLCVENSLFAIYGNMCFICTMLNYICNLFKTIIVITITSKRSKWIQIITLDLGWLFSSFYNENDDKMVDTFYIILLQRKWGMTECRVTAADSTLYLSTNDLYNNLQ